MNSQGRGQRFLVLGAGVLLIGSLGVGSASATDYTGGNTCVEVSGYDHPRNDGNGDGTTDSSTDSRTDTATDPLADATDPLVDATDPLVTDRPPRRRDRPPR